MNGSGHLLYVFLFLLFLIYIYFLFIFLFREDFSIPMGLCPVCLGKIACYFGEDFSLSSRSSHLISAYESVGYVI